MKTLTALFAGTVICAAAAIADDPTRDSEKHSLSGAQAKFAALDRNGDRQLSRMEADPDSALADQFASVDADDNGYINESEYVPRAELMQERSDRRAAVRSIEPGPITDA